MATQRLHVHDAVGTPIDPRNCTRVVQLAVKRAGLPKIRYMISGMACAGAPGAGSAARTGDGHRGHRTLEMTMTVYGHVSVDDDGLMIHWIG